MVRFRRKARSSGQYMSQYSVSVGQVEKHLASSKEWHKVEEEFPKAIENAQAYIKAKIYSIS